MYENLKRAREERGKTQEEMSKLLGYKHKSAYNNIENGKRRIDLRQAKIISDYFKLSIEELFFKN